MDKFNALVNLTRINKPIGIFLLLWPTLCAIWLASEGVPNIKILVIFVLGTILMRSAGCVANDLADRNIDPFVKRTKNRPIAAGIVQPKEALIFLLVLLVFSFVLVIQLNYLTIWISLGALLFSLTYPFSKRYFTIPQLYLGFTFSFGILMAFSAIQNKNKKVLLTEVFFNNFEKFDYLDG